VIQNSYLITIARTILGTILGLIVTGVTAYGFSFKELPYRKKLMFLVLIPMLFNGGIIPYYIQLSRLKLVDNFLVYIIPSMFNIWNMFVMMKFFSQIPASLREAAVIDGAGELKVLMRVILPLSKPVLAAIGLFVAVYHWNDWYSGAFYVSSTKLLPVQTFLQRLFDADNLGMISSNSSIVAEAAMRESQTSQMTVTSVKMAAVVIGTIPILCVYPFVQKHFVKGMLIGSVKE
jgi:putative aldouronate transport system permease protein